MIKAVIFDLDNTLYSYDANHIYGMEALAGYCRETFGITEEETREYYRKAGYIMANRIGTDTAAIHSRMLRLQCMMELLEKPLFPHVQKMYHIYWDAFLQHIEPNPGVLDFLMELRKRKIRIGIGTDMTAYIQYKNSKQSVRRSILILWLPVKKLVWRNHIIIYLNSAWKKQVSGRKSVYSSEIM